MTFTVDFDGTVVTHNYPEVGKKVELDGYGKFIRITADKKVLKGK